MDAIKRRGRPLYKPSDEDRAVVRALSSVGVPQPAIAHYLGLGSLTTLNKYFRDELDSGNGYVVCLAACQLVQLIRDKHPAAIMFALKCRGGWRETDRMELSGIDGNPIDLTVSARELFLSRLRGIAERRGPENAT